MHQLHAKIVRPNVFFVAIKIAYMQPHPRTSATPRLHSHSQLEEAFPLHH
jgi:hypothetical protein